MFFLQNPEDLCYGLSIEAYQRLQTASISATDSSRPLDLLDHRTKQHSSLHSSLNLLQNRLLFGISFKTSTLLGHLGSRLQYITHLRNMLPLATVSHFWL